MPFFDSASPPNPWNDLRMPDGRKLKFFGNSAADDADTFSKMFPDEGNEFHNHYDIELELLSEGVLFAPEVPAVDDEGREFDDGSYALYRDKRLEVEDIAGVFRWVDEALSPLPDISTQTQRRMSKREVKMLVGMAMDNLGLTVALGRIRQEETAKPYDLNAVLREAKEYDGEASEPGGPQHLAQEDLIW